MTSPADVVLAAIRAVEQRDRGRLHELYDPQVVFEWPPGLPHSGRFAGHEIAEMSVRFEALWGPLQPSERERRMDPVVVAASEDHVVVQYRWRASHPMVGRFETPVLAQYRVNGDRLAEARMFYWDHDGLLDYVEQVRCS